MVIGVEFSDELRWGLGMHPKIVGRGFVVDVIIFEFFSASFFYLCTLWFLICLCVFVRVSVCRYVSIS